MSSDQSYHWPVAGDRVRYTAPDGDQRDGILAEAILGKYPQPRQGRVVRHARDIGAKDVGVMVDYDKLRRVPPGK